MQDLETLAKLSGARIGLLRVMAETQLQATTDSLTGLLNRRSFEHRVAALRREEPSVVIAMADLDHFKLLNDSYGHETGDRALRLFAQVLRESLRTQDLVCRHGGEEFAIAIPDCGIEKAREIFDATRVRLDAAMTVAGLPKFTVSFGVVEAEPKDDLPTTISRADAALFQAKREGRDRVVVQDALGNGRSGARAILGIAGQRQRAGAQRTGRSRGLGRTEFVTPRRSWPGGTGALVVRDFVVPAFGPTPHREGEWT